MQDPLEPDARGGVGEGDAGSGAAVAPRMVAADVDIGIGVPVAGHCGAGILDAERVRDLRRDVLQGAVGVAGA